MLTKFIVVMFAVYTNVKPLCHMHLNNIICVNYTSKNKLNKEKFRVVIRLGTSSLSLCPLFL